jgi:dUTP pyrophosphatase
MDVTRMTEKLLLTLDPNSGYTQKDFEKEFMQATVNSAALKTDFYKLKVNFVNESNNPNPEYATPGSSGFDLRANLEEPLEIQAGQRKLVPTGLFFELPDNYELQVRPRSGLAIKQGITVLNTPGTVDSDYRGEVKVILINLSTITQAILHGDRIAQAVIAPVTASNIVKLLQIETIGTNTERGAGGFGSTGLQ